MDNFFTQREEIRDSRYIPNYNFITTQRALNKYIDEIMRLNMWVLDSETTGLDPHVDKVILLQIGNGYQQYLIDTREVQELGSLKEKLEDEGFPKILHNAKFDYKMIKGTFGITAEGMQCLMLLEQLLTAGLQKRGFGMSDCCLKYLGVHIDKEMQTSFIGHTGPFSQKQLQYAALDCVYPYYYGQKMMEKMNELGLKRIYDIECKAIPAFGDMEYYGLKLNKEMWQKNIDDELEKRDAAAAAFGKMANEFLQAYESKLNKDDHGLQKNLFNTFDINPASSVQVLDLFKKMFDHKYLRKSPNDPLDHSLGTGDHVLKKLNQAYNYPPIVESLEAYRRHDKKVGTYGESYINNVHPVTGRFHPSLIQIGTDTGRPAGKKPNMLNVPSEPRYRKPWIAGPNRKILTNDYGACELRIMASMSKDPGMCKGFNDGVDYHTFTVSRFIKDNEPFLKEIIRHPKGEPGKNKKGDYLLDKNGDKIKNPNFGKLTKYEDVCSNERSIAKTINFGRAYGQGAAALAETIKISKDEAKGYIKAFNNEFRTLVNWLNQQQERALEDTVSETVLGRKRFYKLPIPPKVSGELKKMIERGECNINDPFDKNLPKEWKTYYSRLASIKREGANSPIQGGNADITKIAMYRLRKYIRSLEKQHNNGNYLAHIALQVYDEIVVDCPEWYAEKIAKEMDRIMQEAGSEVIKGIPVETGCIIDDSWIKG